MDTEMKIEQLKELNDEAILYEDLEEAFVGIQEKDDNFVALYDINKLIDIFIEQGLPQEDAVDHVYTNIVGAYLGEHSPVFAYMF